MYYGFTMPVEQGNLGNIKAVDCQVHTWLQNCMEHHTGAP